MTSTDQRSTREAGTGLDQLREELTGYVGARAGRLADTAGDKVSGLSDKLLDVAENGGKLPVGGVMKSLIGAKLKSTKDNIVGKVKEKLGGGKGGRKSGDTKVMNIVETLDVGVPIRTAYDHWTKYEAFSGFTKGVRSVSQKDEVSSDWKVKVGPSTRGWSATVQEQVPDDRIVWTSEGAKGSTRGCVSFHELAPSLTRIVLVVEYYPSGFFEKTGNLWRAQGRRLRLDFKHFQRHVTLTDEEAEGWRGEVRDGEVVVSHEDALEREEAEREDQGDEDEERDERDDRDYDYEDEAEDRGEAGEGEEEDDEEEDEEGGPRRYEDEDDAEYEDEAYEDREDDDEDDEDYEEKERAKAGSRAGRRR
ncbi:SRPBCC family protein [Streptomyces sp. Tu 2975]|uniref:SRPBCC family protein n=1 Tax=Streptomyces sp. Tu 2975 TaxID=2676871 RepID=UPI0013590478|nr:SRPBCC family protein [Streptomyces sp. Tu 2975]QIP84004.1 SRPBCC family protein [Streptomyces sp. Tu 2975]